MMIETRGIEGPVVDTVTRFRAPREKLFKIWTEPALIAKWFMALPGYLPPLVELTLAELGPWKIVVRPEPDAGHSIIPGHFFQVVAGRLVYTWTGACADEQYLTLVRVAFESTPDGGSTLLLEHGVFRTDLDRAMHEQGWLSCLSLLERFVAE